jgi:hypothetical protein
MVSFEAMFASLGDAESFLNKFRGKKGHLGGLVYSCCEHGKNAKSGSYLAKVSLYPTDLAVDLRTALDFGSLLSAVRAKETTR